MGNGKLSLKGVTKENVLMLLIGGILLLIIAWPEKTKNIAAFTQEIETGMERETDPEEYKKRIEQQLSELLSQMEGAGEVKVMLMLEGGYEKVEEQEGSLWESQTPSVSVIHNPRITGALILCQGEGKGDVTVLITEAVMNVLGLDANEVMVIKMKKK